MNKYLIIMETTTSGYSAYSPDIPGVIATGTTKSKTMARMKGAIIFHLEGLQESGIKVPHPSSYSEYLEFAK